MQSLLGDCSCSASVSLIHGNQRGQIEVQPVSAAVTGSQAAINAEVQATLARERTQAEGARREAYDNPQPAAVGADGLLARRGTCLACYVVGAMMRHAAGGRRGGLPE